MGAVDPKAEKYRKLSDELNDLGHMAAAAERARAIAAEARQKGDEGYARFFEGEAVFFGGDIVKAEEIEREAVKLLPGVDFIISNYGALLSNLNHHEEAIALFDQALAINPKSDHALSSKGASLAQLGRQEEAIALYDQALAINPNSDHALRGKGVALTELGRDEEAIKLYDQALAINPKSDHALRNKGVALSKLGRNEEAIALYDQALAINPKSDYALTQKGATLSKMGRYSEGLACYQQAQKIKELDGNDYLFLMDIRLGLGEMEEAEKIITLLGTLNSVYADFAKQKLKQKKLENTKTQKQAKPTKVATPLPTSTEHLDHLMLEYIKEIGNNTSLPEKLKEIEDRTKKFEGFLAAGENSDKFFEGVSGSGLLSVLRKWNSYTPMIASVGLDSKGGGYFLRLGKKGIVIDPGFDFIRNFFAQEFMVHDVDYIFITHAHIDHMADLESLFSLLFEAADKAEKAKKPVKQVELFTNLGAMKKLAGWIKLDEKYIRQVHVLEKGQEVFLDAGEGLGNRDNMIRVLATPAQHQEVIDKIYCLGFIFDYQGAKVGFTGDTGWAIDGSIAQAFVEEKCQTLVVHLGTFSGKEIADEKMDQRLERYHLGMLGVLGMIDAVKPKLCLVSEFGEEVGDLRKDLIKTLNKIFPSTKSIAADIGTEVSVSTNPKIRCASCCKFVESCNTAIIKLGQLNHFCPECIEKGNLQPREILFPRAK